MHLKMEALFVWSSILDYDWPRKYPQQFTWKIILKGQKARWAKILKEYDACLWYCKWQYNILVDMLSRMPEINSLAFIEIKSDFLNFMKNQHNQDET